MASAPPSPATQTTDYGHGQIVWAHPHAELEFIIIMILIALVWMGWYYLARKK